MIMLRVHALIATLSVANAILVQQHVVNAVAQIGGRSPLAIVFLGITKKVAIALNALVIVKLAHLILPARHVQILNLILPAACALVDTTQMREFANNAMNTVRSALVLPLAQIVLEIELEQLVIVLMELMMIRIV